ncbi:MAG TPA: cation transporter, partial [Thermoanaerobaculia bacterium]
MRLCVLIAPMDAESKGSGHRRRRRVSSPQQGDLPLPAAAPAADPLPARPLLPSLPVAPPPASPAGPPPASPAGERITLTLEGMHCASCVATIEKALGAVPGVAAASVNLATARADVSGSGLEASRLIAAVRESGYEAALAEDADAAAAMDARSARESRDLLRRVIVAAVLTAPVLVLSMGGIALPARDLICFALTLPVFFWCGQPFLSGMVRTLQHRTANMDTLVGLGTSAAFLLSTAVALFPRQLA